MTNAKRCPESGRPWWRISDRDQCPHCGRMVRAKRPRGLTPVTPEHTYPKVLKGGAS